MQYFLYYMHSVGHGVGLDVHDPMLPTLEPGTVFMIEMGAYVRRNIDAIIGKTPRNAGVPREDGRGPGEVRRLGRAARGRVLLHRHRRGADDAVAARAGRGGGASRKAPSAAPRRCGGAGKYPRSATVIG